jgi:hypothetical protein
LVLEGLRLTAQLLLYREALKSPLSGAFESFCSDHSVNSELIAVFGLEIKVWPLRALTANSDQL